MLDSRKFLLGFFSMSACAGIAYAVLFILLSKTGEIDIDAVVNAQMANERVLFSSGLNQESYHYKLKLLDSVEPEVVAIGSSRAMQVRKQFFTSSFVNLGGAVNSVVELEAMVKEIALREKKPKVALVFVDPWWFVKDFAGNGGVAPADNLSANFSLPLAIAAIKSLKNGNWIAKMQSTSNLGIHAILTNEGFGNDGSYHYTNILSGSAASFDDQSFSDTLDRISKGNRRFEKAARPDPNLLSRTCSALNKLNSLLDHVVVIEPPFASRVWNAMVKGGYEYVEESRAKLTDCVGGNAFHSFMTGNNIPSSTDCEFVDGFHGGDVTYARMISVLADRDADVKHYVNRNYLSQFIDKNGGLAGGTTRLIFKIDEVDFLKIGCEKKTFH